MYSGTWMRDTSLHKTSRIPINTTTDIQYWVNEKGRLMGVCVNFEFADDVYYELEAKNWIKFLRKVLKTSPKCDYIATFCGFLDSPVPQVDFGKVLDAHGIECAKVFYCD